jgi:hypothetical protein
MRMTGCGLSEVLRPTHAMKPHEWGTRGFVTAKDDRADLGVERWVEDTCREPFLRSA